MHVTVTTTGSTLDQLTRDAAKALKAANRQAGRDIAKIGGQAMRKGAPRMWGRPLKIRTKVAARPDGGYVEFFPAPRNAGGWAIQESGRRGGYKIAPKRARSLRIAAGIYAANALGGAWAGQQAWTAAGQRLARALDRTVQLVYDDAMGA